MKRLVLIVEDDRELRAMMAAGLRRAGWDIAEATDGADALRLASQASRPPDVIVLDMMMPVMDADAFLEAQAARRNLADIPVILTTGTVPVPRPRNRAVRAVLSKPFTFQVLDALLKYASASQASTAGAAYLQTPAVALRDAGADTAALPRELAAIAAGAVSAPPDEPAPVAPPPRRAGTAG